MKFWLQVSGIALGFAVACTGAAQAYETQFGDFSAQVGGMTDYRHRGISRSDEKPAVFAMGDWVHDNGFHGGLGATTVDFNDSREAKVEVVLDGGYKFNVLNDLYFDVGLDGFWYPGAD